MNKPYCLGLDVWEGQGEIDEAALKANNIKFLFIRINDMNGGHHKDEHFDKQWYEARQAGLYCAPYFVYNPWVSGLDNYIWLRDHMPEDAEAVAIDIEVRYSAITADKYALEVSKFQSLVKAIWRKVTYTGEWFLPYLSYWDKGDYWWSQYPFLLYPTERTTMTWQKFVTLLETLSGPFNAHKCPGTVKFWQCSGDKLILPGSPRQIDVNVFFGDEAQLAEFFGAAGKPLPEPEPEQEDDAMIEDAIRDAATLIVAKMGELIAAIKDLELPSNGGGTNPPPPPVGNKMFNVHRVVENDVNPNKKVVVTKVPDSNDTNKDVIWVGGVPQEVKVIARWQDVPASLVYWKDLDDIHKMNTYDDWACVVSNWMFNANGNRIPFPEIFVAGGTTRATHCWIHRADLGALLRQE